MSTLNSELRWLVEAAGVHPTTDLVVHVTGDDARTWLNGQITNDVRELPPDTARYATALTVKGRVVTDLWALDEGDGMAVVLPAARADAALERFDKHIIMEDVELTPDRTLAVVTVQGPQAAEVVAAAEAAVRRYACARLGTVGFDCWVPREQLDATLRALTERARALGGGALDEASWAAAHVALGVPRLAADFDEDSYPQEAGLGGRALSFSKGCYLGQEVVYMLEKRGQVARKLVQLEGSAPSAPLARGATVSDADGKRIGEITSFSPQPERALALGYVKRTFADPTQTVWVEGSPWRVVRVVGAA